MWGSLYSCASATKAARRTVSNSPAWSWSMRSIRTSRSSLMSLSCQDFRPKTTSLVAVSTEQTAWVLSLSCPDRPGIVHAVSGLLAEHGGNITESQQFGDPDTGLFFMRVEVLSPAPRVELETAVGLLAESFDMTWSLDVAGDLDEGPIIEQDVERVDHSSTAESLTAIGADVERRALARAVRWHAEHRVLLDRHRTIVFR